MPDSFALPNRSIEGDFSAKALKTSGNFEVNNGTANGALKLLMVHKKMVMF